MKGRVRYGNSVINYSVVKSRRRKTSQIVVDKNGVLVRTPLNKPDKEIEKIVDRKKQWIFKKQLEFGRRLTQKPIKVHPKAIFKRRVHYYASKLGVFPHRIVVKDLKSRWGSATKDNVINLNVDLLKAPKKVIDYVILHELCHLKIQNHSHRFWSLLRKFMPDYENQKRWLDLNGKIIL
ncbi:MAG: M48 family metallopeptidase [Nitrosopumilaceae archaeon]